MKKLWKEYKIVIILFIAWRVLLGVIEWVAPFMWVLRDGFLGPLRWANFDGVHYLSIARNGYYTYEQAFFPLYPMLIHWVSRFPLPDDITVALAISHISFLGGVLLFYDLARSISRRSALWCVVFLLLFPTSFFFASAYTESLFFLLSAACMVAARRKLWWLAGIAGMLASGTRLFGIFLFPVVLWQYVKEQKGVYKWWDIFFVSLIPLGLLAYMRYLMQTIGDPLAFFHVQSAFGAGRSGRELILLPQVLWRYMRIIVTVAPSSIIYAISVFELAVFSFGLWLVWYGFRKKIINAEYLAYALAILMVPTFTGTFSSLPRYFLSAFPLFFILGSVHNTGIKVAIGVLFTILLIAFGAAFLQGYFVA